MRTEILNFNNYETAHVTAVELRRQLNNGALVEQRGRTVVITQHTSIAMHLASLASQLRSLIQS